MSPFFVLIFSSWIFYNLENVTVLTGFPFSFSKTYWNIPQPLFGFELVELLSSFLESIISYRRFIGDWNLLSKSPASIHLLTSNSSHGNCSSCRFRPLMCVFSLLALSLLITALLFNNSLHSLP